MEWQITFPPNDYGGSNKATVCGIYSVSTQEATVSFYGWACIMGYYNDMALICQQKTTI